MKPGINLLHRVAAGLKRNLMGAITHVNTHDTVAAITFDDGPNPDSTPSLLEVLSRYQVRATFFMVGKSAERYRELVKLVAQAGHAIGNHSWDHPFFSRISGREARNQIRACSMAIAPYGQRLFRPPYGDQTGASSLNALWTGYKVVTWNLVAEDWLDHDADWMANLLLEGIQPGSIILLHDNLYQNGGVRNGKRQQMLKAIEIFLQQVGNRYHFVTVPELLKHGRPQRQNWDKS